MKMEVLKNRCVGQLVKWGLAHRSATKNLMRAIGFGNSGDLIGAIEDLDQHYKGMRSTIIQALEILVAGDLNRALSMIDTLKCGPAGCPLPEGSHNGDCLEITKSKIKSLFLAFPVQVPIKIQVSPPSKNPERERLLANEMFARGILAAADARKEGFSVPVDFEKSWADLCGSLACASRDGWKAFAIAVDRETGCIVPEEILEHPYGILISRLKQAIITSEIVMELVRALQSDPATSILESIREPSAIDSSLKPKRKRTQKGATPDWITEALILLQQNPGISGAEAARRVGVSKSTLTQNLMWRQAVAAYQPSKSIVTQFQKRGGVRKRLSNAQSNEENDTSDENS